MSGSKDIVPVRGSNSLHVANGEAGQFGATTPHSIRQALQSLEFGESLYIPYDTVVDEHLNIPDLHGKLFSRRFDTSTKEYIITRVAPINTYDLIVRAKRNAKGRPRDH